MQPTYITPSPPVPVPVQPVPVQPVPVQPVPVQPSPIQPAPIQPYNPQVPMPQPPMPGSDTVQPYMPQPPMPQPPMPQPPISGGYVPQPPMPGGYVPQPSMPGGYTYQQHLKVLESVGGLYIKQKAEMLEAFTGFETCNKYKIYLTGPDCVRADNQDSYFKAVEESECCQRQFCGNQRSFTMTIFGPDKQPVIILERPFKCSCICCNLPELSIKDAAGNYIGRVKNLFDCCGYSFTIYDKDDMPTLSIHGDCCQCGQICPCADVTFDVINPSTQSVGYIKKIFSGFAKELLTDADSFVLSFPPDATVDHKMLLLGSVFLIDFMFFEDNKDRND